MTSLSTIDKTQVHQTDNIITAYPKGDFTYVTSASTLLTKQYSYDEVNKQLSRSKTIFPVSGDFDRQNNASLGNLFKDMSLITQHNAFIQGVAKEHEQVGICAKGDIKDGCIARIKDNFKYPGNAFILFDYDPSDRGYTVPNVGEFISILESIEPQLQTCAYTSKSSASSGIKLDGELLKNDKGFHLYMAIPGEQLKSYAKTLFKLLILKGYGHVFISINGRMSIRTIFDAAVHSPERLDFIAPAIVEYPLTINEPEIHSRPGSSIDGNLLSELTTEQEQKLQKVHQQLLDDAEDEAFDVRMEYIKIQSDTTGISKEKLFKHYMMGDQGEIDFEHPLTKDDGTQFSFADVIATPDVYSNLSMRDPFDPANGPNKAQLYVNDNGTIVINSFAHGGTVYKLHQDSKLYTGKTSKNRREFKMISPAEILAKSPVPNWLIKSYIIQGSVVQIIAKSEAGKSFATIDIGLSVATGQDWNNCKVVQGPVAYLNAEGYKGVTARIQGWQQEHQSILRAPFSLSEQALDLTDDDAIASAQVTLDRFAQEHDNHISLIIVDTMRRSMTGDENSSHVFEKFLSNLEYLCRLYGATALINHHPGHNGDLARGSSAQFAAMDTQLLLIKKNGKFQLECTKLKDGGKKPNPVGFELREIQLPDLDEDGKHVTTCIPEYIPLSGQQSTGAVKLKRMSVGLIDALKSFSDILKSNGTTETLKDDWRDELVTLRTLQDPANKKDIAAAKKIFGRSFKDLTEAGVVVINSVGSYQYGNDIEPQWSDVKSYVPGEYFK